MSAVQRKPLTDSQDNAGIIAQYDAELLWLTETEPAQPNRLLYGLLNRDPSMWVYTEEQKAKDARVASVPFWVTLERVRREPVDPQNPLGWLYAARQRDGKA